MGVPRPPCPVTRAQALCLSELQILLLRNGSEWYRLFPPGRRQKIPKDQKEGCPAFCYIGTPMPGTEGAPGSLL